MALASFFPTLELDSLPPDDSAHQTTRSNFAMLVVGLTVGLAYAQIPPLVGGALPTNGHPLQILGLPVVFVMGIDEVSAPKI